MVKTKNYKVKDLNRWKHGDGSKTILIVSDLHVGSQYGLMPPKARMDPDQRRKGLNKAPSQFSNDAIASKVQRDIYARWLEMVKAVGHVDMCVVNGDICDGVNPKSKGLGLWTSDLSVQTQTAVDLLNMIDADHFCGTQESLYHTGDNISTDRAVIKELGGDYRSELAVKVDDIRFHFSHKVGVSSSAWFYRPTPIAREMMLAAPVKEEVGSFDVVVRSHAHYFYACPLLLCRKIRPQPRHHHPLLEGEG